MKEFELKYGCNPNQKPAKIYMQDGSELPIEILCGRPGYINFLDAFNSWQLVKELKTNSLHLIRGDVFRYLNTAPSKSFDFIFADPPYALKELPEVPTLIFERDLLRNGGVFVMEHPKTNDFSGLPYFYQHRVYGSVNFSIFIK